MSSLVGACLCPQVRARTTDECTQTPPPPPQLGIAPPPGTSLFYQFIPFFSEGGGTGGLTCGTVVGPVLRQLSQTLEVLLAVVTGEDGLLVQVLVLVSVLGPAHLSVQGWNIWTERHPFRLCPGMGMWTGTCQQEALGP